MIGGSRAASFCRRRRVQCRPQPTGEFRLTITGGGGWDEVLSVEPAGNWADLRMEKILARNSSTVPRWSSAIHIGTRFSKGCNQAFR